MALIIIETQEDECVVFGRVENNVSVIKNEKIKFQKETLNPTEEVVPALQEIEF
jgi:hypothetical protein